MKYYSAKIFSSVVLFCLAYTWLVGAVFAQTVQPNSRKPAPVEPKGIAVVFDASESMCGYLVNDAKENKLVSLIKVSSAMRDPDANQRVYLLKQQVKSSVVAARDVVEAPASLQAQALTLAEKTTKSGTACSPFNGIGSNLELVFDPTSPTSNAQAVVLVTDGQMIEKDREKFVDNFVAWAKSAHANNFVPHAGIALVQSQFAGKYYPVTEPDSIRRKAGYELPAHKRPLLLMWFARSSAQMSKVHALVEAMGGAKMLTGDQGFVQHLLPLPAVGDAWLTSAFQLSEKLSTHIGAKPKIDIKLTDSSRSERVVASCLDAKVSDKTIFIEASQTCADGKPLFDGVADMVVTFGITPTSPYYLVRGKGAPTISWRLNSKAYGEEKFQLIATAVESAKPAARSGVFSVDSDYCPAQTANGKKSAAPPVNTSVTLAMDACTDKLEGRAYQLDILLEMLHSRRLLVSDSLLAPLAEQTFNRSFKQRGATR